MRTFDLSPLYRSTIGFDRVFSLLDQLAYPGTGTVPGYPPYNIERTGEETYRITMAVAGFGEQDINVEVKESALTVKGEKVPADNPNAEVLYRGIAGRAFERRFQLADHVEVTGATLENGLLHVDLARRIPEAMKPRTIAVETRRPANGAPIEAKAAA
ncbi:MAG: Hsp20 family protein [Bauldia sp.]